MSIFSSINHVLFELSQEIEKGKETMFSPCSAMIAGRGKYFSPFNNQAFFSLAYHEVNDQVPAFMGKTEGATGVSRFRRHVEFARNNFHCVGVDDLVRDELVSSPQARMLFSFDDGFIGNYRYALPILQEYNCPAVVFLTTDLLERKSLHWRLALSYAIEKSGEEKFRKDLRVNGIEVPGKNSVMKWTKRYFKPEIQVFLEDYLSNDDKKVLSELFMDWDQVKEMWTDNICFGLHTCSHPVMSSLTYDEQYREIKESLDLFIQRTGKEPVAYAHPFGTKRDYNQDTLSILKELLPGKPVFSVYGGVNFKINLEDVKRICIHDWPLRKLLNILYYNYYFG